MTREQQEQMWRAGETVCWKYGQWECSLTNSVIRRASHAILCLYWRGGHIEHIFVPRSITVREAKQRAADWILAEIERWAGSVEVVE